LAHLIILVTVAVDTPNRFGNFNERNPMIYYQTNRNQGSKIEKEIGLGM
jgi:hypothetical protein